MKGETINVDEVMAGLPRRMLTALHRKHRGKCLTGFPLWHFVSDTTLHGSGYSNRYLQDAGLGSAPELSGG